jgi:hypothetical protein
MLGSFPGVFLFQMLSGPKIVEVVVVGSGLTSLSDPSEVPLGTALGLGFIILVHFAVASLLGFYIGWRVAWEIAAGRSVRELVTSGRLVRPLSGGLQSSVASWKASAASLLGREITQAIPPPL